MRELMTAFERKRFDFAFRLGIFGAIVGFALAWILYDRSGSVLLFFDFSTSPNDDTINIGGLCLLLTGALTFACCLVPFKALFLERDELTAIERVALKGRQNIVARLTVSFVTTIIIMLVAWILWILLGIMFQNLRLPFLNALLVTSLYCGALSFYVTRWIVGLDSNGLISLAFLTFGLGLMGSFLLVDDPEWWRNSLSYLGFASGSSALFSWSVICVGIFMLALWRDIINTLNVLVEAGLLKRRSLTIFAIGSTIASLGVIGVGVFPVRVTPFTDFMHNLSVNLAGLTFILGMLGVKWIIPNIYHPNFIRLGYQFTALCVVFFIMYQFLGMLNFVALEIFSFAVFAGWIYYFNEYTFLFIRQQDIELIEEGVKRANRPLWEQLELAVNQI